MAIFIGNLPAQVTEASLAGFVRLPAGAHLRLIKKKARDGELIRFGLVQMEDARQARKLIARLNGKPCIGHKLVVREYLPRVAGNERRRLDWRNLAWHGEERRWDERRTIFRQDLPLQAAASAA